jgi:hypothetical protein
MCINVSLLLPLLYAEFVCFMGRCIDRISFILDSVAYKLNTLLFSFPITATGVSINQSIMISYVFFIEGIGLLYLML